jgi:transposase InsO family protein
MADAGKRKPREERFPVAFMCEILDVSRQGYYAWCRRAPSARQLDDEKLAVLITEIHQGHEGRYGIDRIHRELARRGHAVGPQRVRRLARAAGLRCVHPRPYKVTTVQDPANAAGLVDLVGREFVPAGRDQLWYGDITYISTMTGWAFLATVIDGFSRKVVGWSVADHMREELVIDALSMALASRNPGIGEVVFHSDRAVSTRAVIFAMLACPTGSYRRSAVPVSVLTTPPRSRGMRRSRKSSSTCACGGIPGTFTRPRSNTSRCITTGSGYRRNWGICRQPNSRKKLT